MSLKVHQKTSQETGNSLGGVKAPDFPNQLILLFILMLIVFSISGCRKDSDWPTVLAPSYWPTTGWRASTPEEQGMDSLLLGRIVEDIMNQQSDLSLKTLSIIRHGFLVSDVHFTGGNDAKEDIGDGVRAILSTLFGIAIDEGLINGTDQQVLTYFPYREIKNLNQEKRSMVIEDLLTMRSGIQHKGDSDEIEVMERSSDWIQFALDLPMSSEPGKKIVESRIDQHLLSALLDRALVDERSDFAQDRLFQPLGIDTGEWSVDPQGNVLGYGGLELTAHDLAKIGFLYMHKGIWAGQEIVSRSWVEEATHAKGPRDGDDQNSQFGYLWQIWNPGYFGIAASDGISIYVIPEQGVLIVVSSDKPTFFDIGGYLISDHIMPSIQSRTGLPPNPSGESYLKSMTAMAAIP